MYARLARGHGCAHVSRQAHPHACGPQLGWTAKCRVRGSRMWPWVAYFPTLGYYGYRTCAY